jgi:hypothetical protein
MFLLQDGFFSTTPKLEAVDRGTLLGLLKPVKNTVLRRQALACTHRHEGQEALVQFLLATPTRH